MVLGIPTDFDLPLNGHIDVQRAEDSHAAKEQPQQNLLLQLPFVDRKHQHGAAQKQGAQNMQGNQKAARSLRHTGGLEFDHAKQSHDEKQNGKNDQRDFQHDCRLAGVAR